MSISSDIEDYYNMSVGSDALLLLGSQLGATHQTIDVENGSGDVVLSSTYGYRIAPVCDYTLKADWTPSLELGSVITHKGIELTIAQINIVTQAGSPPSINIQGEQVESYSNQIDTTVTVPGNVTIKACHHAQAGLWGCPTLTSTGCYIDSATYNINGQIFEAWDEDSITAFDIHSAQINCQYTIIQVGDYIPTFTTSDNWTLTQPLTLQQNDSDYPRWAVSYTRFLQHD